jgi:PAS domain S-box-containing protein
VSEFDAVHSLLDEAPVGFLSISEHATVALVNATLARMLGYEARELVGRDVREVFTTPTRIFYQTHFFPLVRLQQHAEELYLTLATKMGEVIPVLVNAVVRERDGVRYTDCVMMRIHERQKYEEALLQARRAADEANRAKVEFLSMMSHDLRTPLNAVTGYSDLLLAGVRGPLNDGQRKDLERIKSASRFLLGLINDILSFARLELGKAELHIKPVKLDDVLLESEAMLEQKMRDAGISYVRSRMSDALFVTADPDRLKQILLNLLTNAVKFTPSGGRITVSSTRAGDRVHISVADTGRGIPPDRIADIFKPFSQVDPQGDKKKGGVGLGLAIGRELARSMDGDLTVASVAGQGSEFTITLPAT